MSMELLASDIALNATSQMAFELSSLVITAIVGVIGFYIRRFLSTNEYIKKYNLYNEKTERVLSNALAYAETKAKTVSAEQIDKRNFAISYIEMISPDIIAKEGAKLELMLDRKVHQLNSDYTIK